MPQLHANGSRKRGHEIDIVYAYEGGVVVIEVKSWSGQLIAHGDKWLQKRRNNGGDIWHDNVLHEVTPNLCHPDSEHDPTPVTS